MASFDIKSELDHHELTNAVDQANRILQNRFDFKGTGAEFSINEKQILERRLTGIITCLTLTKSFW